MDKELTEKYYDFLLNNKNIDSMSGVELKSIRKSFNLSQRCFAEMLNISVKTLENYEIGHRSIPGPSRSLFIFARDNQTLFKKKYLKLQTNIREFVQ